MNLLFYCIILFATTINCNNPGNLDTSFNQAGTGPSTPGSAILDLSDPAQINLITSTALQTDGNIVVAGFGSYAGQKMPAVARFLSDGSLDESFNINGISPSAPGYHILNIAGATEAAANAITIDYTSGNIVITGYAIISGVYKVFVARLIGGDDSAAGTLDTSFNGSGITTFMIPSSATGCNARGVCIQRQTSNIIITGDFNNAQGVFIARILGAGSSAGSLDTTGFASPAGYATLFTGNTGSIAYAIDIQPLNDRYVITGYTTVDGVQQIFVARFLTTGYLDNTTYNISDPYGINGQGYTTTNIENGAQALSLSVKGDGTALTAGYNIVGTSSPSPIALAQFTSTGQPDQNFGDNGVALLQIIDNNYQGAYKAIATGVATDPNGKIVTTGSVYYNSSAIFPFLARCNVNGSFDTTFNPLGYIMPRINSGMVSNSLTVQPDTKPIFAGYSLANDIHQMTIARFIGGSLENQATESITDYGYNALFIDDFLYQSFYTTIITDPSVQSITLDIINSVIANYIINYSEQPNFNYIAYLYLLQTQLLLARNDILNLYPLSADEINACFDCIDSRIVQLIEPIL